MKIISPLLRILGLALFSVCLVLSSGCSNTTTATANPTAAVAATPQWVAAWGAPPENALPSSSNAGGSEQSFRFLLSPTVSGTRERVHFTNYYGTVPLTIGAARLAISPNDNAVIDPASDHALTFSGSASVTIPAGQEVISDPVQIAYSYGQKLAVSMYVKGTFPSLTQHGSLVQQNYSSPVGAGDTTKDSTGSAFSLPMTEWFLLSGIDVYGPYQGTVVLFGSSSIDGYHSDFGNSSSYPTPNVAVPGHDSDRPSDWLARQLIAAGYNLGVLNAGVIADPAGTNGAASPASGVMNGIDRENRDVLQQAGVTTMITYLGAVDIKSQDCKSAPDVENYLTTIIQAAASANIRVIVGTLPPSTFCTNSGSENFGLFPTSAAPYAGGATTPGPINPGETQRMLVNSWIRTTAVNLPGVVGIADFDKALADPANPSFLLPNLNSGDNTHPNGVGYGVQSSAIPLDKILPPITGK